MIDLPRRRVRRQPQRALPPGDYLRRMRYAGALLTTSREAMGLSREQIAKEIGLAPSAVRKIEQPPEQQTRPGEKWPHVPNVEKVMLYCDVVGIDYCDLFPPKPSSRWAQLRRYLASADPRVVPRLVHLMAVFMEDRAPVPFSPCVLAGMGHPFFPFSPHS
jgi:transcriptional regulator with XRE-family HTH domain